LPGVLIRLYGTFFAVLQSRPQWKYGTILKNPKSWIVINRCDICDDRIMCSDDIENQIDKLVEVNNSYESENDKEEPRLLLCDYCQKEYMIPAYPI
jgi:hypothetical protein